MVSEIVHIKPGSCNRSLDDVKSGCFRAPISAMQTTQKQHSKAESLNEPKRPFKPNLLLLLGLFSFCCGAMSVVRIVQIILNVGGNNISNDYLDVVPAISRAFSGQMSAFNLLSDLKVGQHFVALPVVFHLLAAYLFDWNARAELIIGVVLNLVKSLLICDLLSRGYKKELQLLVLGGVLALVFSMTQASIHFFGQACFPVNLCTLGFTVALWGIIRWRDWRGVLLMLAGGIGSAASMGNVPACWAALLAAMILLGFKLKERGSYLAWLGGALVSIAPYLYFHAARPAVLNYCQHAFDGLFFINMLGRPFANQVGLQVGRLAMSEFAGVAGLLLLVVALGANLRLKNFSLPVKASVAMCVYGLVSGVMLSCVRSYVCPWYSAFAIYFWLGLFGLFVSALQPGETTGSGEKQLPMPHTNKVWKLVAIGGLVFITFIYAASNRSWRDKHVYLSTRSPASEAGLRNFREAPSYIESSLFQWGDGRPKNVTALALPLEKYQLSAFAPDQTWTLQGDFVLPRVRVFNSGLVPPVRFIEDKTADHTVPWSHYEHANVYVHSPNTISWTISLPADLIAARLKSAYAIGYPNKNAKPVITDGAIGKVLAVFQNDSDLSPGKKVLFEKSVSKAGEWHNIDVDLSTYRGKTITLLFTSNGNENGGDDFSVFQHPSVDVKLRRRSNSENDAMAKRLLEDKVLWRPVNTDLNSSFGKNFDPTKEMVLPPLSSSDWRRAALKVDVPRDVRGSEKGRSDYWAMYFTPEKPINADDFSHLIVSMTAKRMYGRSLKVIVVPDAGKPKTISIPLPEDSQTHLCSYDLKLCELPIGCRIKQLVLYPADAPNGETRSTITVNRVSLAKEKTPFWYGGIK